MAKTILLIIKASNKINYSNTNTHSHAHAHINSIGKDVKVQGYLDTFS